MGLINLIRYAKVYLDANIFIYTFGGYSIYREILLPVIDLSEKNEIFAVTSELTLAEVMVAPLMRQNKEIEQLYDSVIQDSSTLSVVPLKRNVLLSAAALRARYSIKLPDALHLATAQITDCRFFLTNDNRFKSINNLQVLYLRDYIV